MKNLFFIRSCGFHVSLLLMIHYVNVNDHGVALGGVVLGSVAPGSMVYFRALIILSVSHETFTL